ncbi:MAG: dissimilatory sulfite reductase D family protein [Desulfohalobiaceae bacterium]
MANEEAKQKVIDELQKKSKTKTKFYFNDLSKILDLKPREAKKIINEMITERSLVYWSSGSTTMYSLPGVGKQAASEGED